MLHRSYSLLNFIKRSVTVHSDQFLVFRIRYSKQQTSILVTARFVHVLSSSHKICSSLDTDNIQELKVGVHNVLRGFSTKDPEVKSKASTDEKSQKRVVLSGEKKLSKLKEKILKVTCKKDDGKSFDDDKKDEKALKESASTKKKRTDRNTESLERNFITPSRAMSDFLLKPTDLETLPKTKRRSPYEFDPPITVYWRKDVEAKALEVWGSREALLKELLRKELERKTHEQNFFTVKRRVRDYRRQEMSNTIEDVNHGLFGRSGKVVLTAVATNLFNLICKFFAWLSTGSHSMFSECVHSAADTLNQVILAYGIQKSVQNPNPDHPYGFTNMQYVASLASGVGILCAGAGLSIYHGCHGLMFPIHMESFYWAYVTLACSFVLDGISFRNAYMSTKKAAMEKGKTFKEYVLSGQDPSVNVVLMEDFAAVLGVLCAAGCMGLTSYLGNPAFDAIGSLLVGGLLGGVSLFIIRTNSAALMGRSIPQEILDKINAVLEADIMVRTVHDVKGIDMGNSVVRYKAELDFDGRELTRSYLDKHDLNRMFEEVKQMQNIEQLEAFLLNHGENIVDLLGAEIDRIELKLKKKHPEIRHCDLEIS